MSDELKMMIWLEDGVKRDTKVVMKIFALAVLIYSVKVVAVAVGLSTELLLNESVDHSESSAHRRCCRVQYRSTSSSVGQPSHIPTLSTAFLTSIMISSLAGCISISRSAST